MDAVRVGAPVFECWFDIVGVDVMSAVWNVFRLIVFTFRSGVAFGSEISKNSKRLRDCPWGELTPADHVTARLVIVL